MTLLNRAIPAQKSAAGVLNYPSLSFAWLVALSTRLRFFITSGVLNKKNSPFSAHSVCLSQQCKHHVSIRYFTLTLMKKEDVCRLHTNNA